VARVGYGVGIVHGLIVIDGKLFTAEVRDRSNIEVQESQCVPYIFNYASKEYGYRKILIDVVTIEGLPDYIRRYDKWRSQNAVNSAFRSCPISHDEATIFQKMTGAAERGTTRC
jgi:hypothetical protein